MLVFDIDTLNFFLIVDPIALYNNPHSFVNILSVGITASKRI